MSILVNHDERRREILHRAMGLFAEDGYADVTFQRIADRCGLARTALYKYFHHKRQIFDGAATMATNDLALKYREILTQPGSYAGKLDAVMEEVLRVLFAHRELLLVITEYAVAMKRSGKSMRWVIARHTRDFKAALRYLLVKGTRAGEFAPMNTRITTDVLYALLESTVVRLTLTGTADIERQKAMVRQVLRDLPRRSGQNRAGGPFAH